MAVFNTYPTTDQITAGMVILIASEDGASTLNAKAETFLAYMKSAGFAGADISQALVNGKTLSDALKATPSAALTVTENITAAGSAMGTAASAPSQINVVTLGADGSGVILSPTYAIGTAQIVMNRAEVDVLVYPPSATGSIENLGAGVGFSLPAGGVMRFWRTTGTQYRIEG